MGLLSSSSAVVRYRVEGSVPDPFIDTTRDSLKRDTIQEIDKDPCEKVCGWTSFQTPFAPQFDDSSFMVGEYLVFSFRVDTKKVPSKVVKKNYEIETARRLADTGREYLSKNEKKEIKERVKNVLLLRIPATPNQYDVVWHYEHAWLWFFSSSKSVSEEFESLFLQSFGLRLIRMFPFTLGDLSAGLSEDDRDRLQKITYTGLTSS